MRIRYWASILICASSACADRPQRSNATTTLAEATVASATAEHGRTRLVLQLGNVRDSVALDRDATVAPEAPPSRVNIIARMPGTAIVIMDTYPSLAGGLSYCQAGEEAFLRVISTFGQTAAKRYDMKVGSCRDNLELADSGIEWDASGATLRVHWLRGPSGKEEKRHLAIRPDGRVDVVSAP